MDLPENIKGAIDRYVEERIQPGGFTSAVLENNLAMAIGRADENSLKAIREIVGYVYNEIPSRAWGSQEKVQSWLAGDD